VYNSWQLWGETDDEKTLEDFDLCNRVFVYGSLKKGEWNNRILGDSDLLSETVTKGDFCLGNVGFPYAFSAAITPDEYKKLLHPVRGEVWKVDTFRTFLSLDGLEGYPHHYNRRIIRTTTGLSAWMYMNDNWSDAERCAACKLKNGEWIWESN